MSVAALELNDTGLVIALDGELTPPSPAYAHLNRAGVTVGPTALAAARLEPTNVSSRFWRELDDRPLPVLAAEGRSSADLAFQHLQAVFEPVRARIQNVIAVVPGSIQPRQLMLVLGIAREAGLPLSGFLDAAVAAAAAWGGQGRFIYVDVHQHETVLTAVEVGERARRERVESVPQAGRVAFIDRWMKLVSRRFIERTRFDPLHEARSEQGLFEVLPSWLAQLESDSSIDVEMAVGGETHRVPLSRELIETEAQPLYAQILLAAHRLRRAGHVTTIGLSERAARLPGLLARFAEFQDCDVVGFPAGAAALAATQLDLPWSVDENNAVLVRTAPLLPAGAPFAPVNLQRGQATASVAAPTHALYRGLAHAVSARPLVVGTGPQALGVQLQIAEASAGISRIHCSLLRSPEGAVVIDHSRHGTWLNDERVVSRAPLRAGDRLRLGNPGVAIELIAIE